MKKIQNNQPIQKEALRGKKVLVRVDFNVPTKDGNVEDITRIRNAYPTIKFLQDAGARIILMSHLGKTTAPNPKQSLRILLEHVSREFKANVAFIEDFLSDETPQVIKSCAKNDIILLENLRFHPEEEACDPEFAKKLASLADFYINEAFSVAHRKHASVYEVPKYLPHAFGIGFVKELEMLDGFLEGSRSPKMCIIGGAKLSSKVKLLKNLATKVDYLALGGGIAGAFLGYYGNSSFKVFNQEGYDVYIKEILESAEKHNCKLVMPTDFSALIGTNDEHMDQAIISSSGTENANIFDIGPESVEIFKKYIHESSTVLWNGPLGLFEKSPFDFGTRAVAEEVAKLTREKKIISIVGGGDTTFAMNKFNVSQDLTYQSTSGGAFLTYLEGSELYGISSMEDGEILKE